jgi:Sulfotransferase domain
MRKKILVISHERSGTHFLINTIARCFDYLPNQIDLDNSCNIDWGNPAMARQWLLQFRGRSVANIFKSHHASTFLVPLLPDLQDDFHVFYIQRDGRDVMTSFWIYLNRLAPGWGPRTRSIGEFMQATAAGGIAQYQSTQQNMTMLERWVTHVRGWTQPGLPIHHFTYEALHSRYETELEKISGILQQPPVSRIRPTLESPSSLPWRGSTGTWREFFTEADIAYYDRHTKEISG